MGERDGLSEGDDASRLDALRAHYRDYRAHLQDACQRAQESFDKTVLSLSGGALGVSFVFLKDVIGEKPIAWPGALLCAWASWAASSLCVLFSFHLSYLALRKAIKQVDDGSIASQRAGGAFAAATAALNVIGAALFFIGVVLIIVFAGANLTDSRSQADGNKTAPTAPAPSSATPGAAQGPGRHP